ncbi:hypothetical protein LX64_02666 [Chitinophaga skermanii]|uniref:Uncharacterized protein n=1 Tax=Chitinophaga skermanii TaxID=331697 RepID=A0A327QLF8_9BACT|nr:hypothetical protein [Chitinophaga skermanii]RAJ05506.1 hypothetical protein LX64_02666 [Chitinophaga skermanii]
MSANLEPKVGWYDEIIPGSDNGMHFTIGKHKISAETLYSMMLKDGYINGAQIRLMSCRSGAFSNGAAAQLSKLTNAKVIAPTGDLTIFPKNYNGLMPVIDGQFHIGRMETYPVGKFVQLGE